jgi:isopentenyl-diphosphate delta-isomerase
VSELSVPVIAKETGNGIGGETAAMLRTAGIRTVDTSGAGGTSWVGVETLRAEGASRALGELLWDWGVPTAASVLLCKRESLEVIATGGIKSGYDVARAIALGATACGIARIAYQAYIDGGREGAEALFDSVERELAAVMLLTGSRTVEALKSVPRTLTGELRDYAG